MLSHLRSDKKFIENETGANASRKQGMEMFHGVDF